METYRGVVYPAQTDVMGHMNIQYYTAAFDQAMWHLVAALGYDARWQHERGEGWADVRHTTHFMKELPTGALYTVRSTVRHVGRSSLTMLHQMFTQQGELAATMEMKSVYFDLRARTSLPLPDAIRTAAANHLESVQQ